MSIFWVFRLHIKVLPYVSGVQYVGGEHYAQGKGIWKCFIFLSELNRCKPVGLSRGHTARRHDNKTGLWDDLLFIRDVCVRVCLCVCLKGL